MCIFLNQGDTWLYVDYLIIDMWHNVAAGILNSILPWIDDARIVIKNISSAYLIEDSH